MFRVKTSSGNVVATSFLYLTVHRWIACDVPIYLKFALKVTHPFRKRRFRLIVPQPWELARKVQLSRIGSRQCAFHPAIDELCALPKFSKEWLKSSIQEFLHYGVAFHFFVAGNRRHFKFGVWVEHRIASPSLYRWQTVPKWARSRHVSHFNERKLTFAIRYRRTVCLSVVCNVRAPYSAGWNFRQFFFAVWYIGHPLTSTENFTEIVPVEPLRRGV